MGIAKWISDKISDKTQRCWVSQEEEKERWLRKAAGLSIPALAAPGGSLWMVCQFDGLG